MSIVIERPLVHAPTTYQEWLSCFEIMKGGSSADNEVFDAVCQGTFVGSDTTLIALQKQIVGTVNAMLDKSVNNFIRNLNENMAFNEFLQTELLFKRLKKDINRSLFFTELSFLTEEFREELEGSVKEQMSSFWNDTVRFLYERSLEFSDPELEDMLFLVKRIRLFQ